MSCYRRFRIPGGTYFFAVNLARPGDTSLTDHIGALRQAYAHAWRRAPWHTDAIVVLPDHLLAIWTLPPGDSDFSDRWRRIKREFTVSTGLRRACSTSKQRKGEAGLWQRRFWEHWIRNEAEKAAAIRHVWTAPVRHGLVERAVDWPYSSIHRDIARGRLLADAV